MSGQQHPSPTGFPNAQQNTIRNQFSGGQMVSGQIGPEQGKYQSINDGFSHKIKNSILLYTKSVKWFLLDRVWSLWYKLKAP